MSSSFEYRAVPACTDSRFSDSAAPTRASEFRAAQEPQHSPKPAPSIAQALPHPLHIVTPLIDTEINGRRVSLKLDNLQPARSFKLRGIGHLCQHYAQRGARKFVCSSAGNAGYAVAWVGRAMNVPVTVVVPSATPMFVRKRIAALGAEVLAVGEIWDHANAAALELAEQPGCAFIPPFDHPLIWSGHATLVEELAQQCREAPDAILLAVGGGGLLLGVLEGLRRVGWLDTRVFAVEPEGAAALGESIVQGRVVELSVPRSVASSLCVRRVAEALIPACRDRDVTALTVSDEAATSACVRLAEDHGLVVEPACGAALAPLYSATPELENAKRIVAIVCGGMVVTLEQLATWRRSRTAPASVPGYVRQHKPHDGPGHGQAG
jgi:L-serine/L-threonine ammonia-lyase